VKLVLVILALAGLTGCARLSDAQAVQLSQAKADVTAARMTVDPEARSALLMAAASRLMAGLNDLDLPPAPHPAQSLVDATGAPAAAAVAQEVQESKAAEQSPPSGILGMILAGAGGVGLLALSVLKLSPGAFGMVAQLAHTVLAPRATREMRAVQLEATAVAQQAVAYGHAVTQAAEAAGLKPTLEVLKDQFGRQQDDLGIRPQIDTLLQAFKDGRLPVKPA